MSSLQAYITGAGIVSALGNNVSEVLAAIKSSGRGIRPISLFPVSGKGSLPVGGCSISGLAADVPRSHALALEAARQAIGEGKAAPDAVIIGTTTGGMLETEKYLKDGRRDPDKYVWHAAGSIAEYLAAEYKCTGPVLTVSTACSSGSAVIKLALEMIRKGIARNILVGGADSLCRLTYYGFNSLQLLDPEGARPFDRDRRGMSVAEGAAVLYITGAETAPSDAIAMVPGGGLSCDAHHPAAPHPEGAGALNAMKAALKDAGISADKIDYISLHGTGTRENDASEAKGIASLFGSSLPFLSSIKGATGHSLAAAGAIEAVVSCLCIEQGFVPANTGCVNVDEETGLDPVREPVSAEVNTVLSNSFGFGGNNAAVLFSRPGFVDPVPDRSIKGYFSIIGASCITSAGDVTATIEALKSGKTAEGLLPLDIISEKLPQRSVRRMKRLPRIALSLAVSAQENAGTENGPDCISFGTAWGALSETNDFLMKLYETDEEFTSPTDFVGSVHNAPAGQVAIWLKSQGPNMTVTGGDWSFEQALMTAGLIASQGEKVLVMGADEYHKDLSPLFDTSVTAGEPSDGGGALMLEMKSEPHGVMTAVKFFEYNRNNPQIVSSLIACLGGPDAIAQRYAAVFAGLPAAEKDNAHGCLDEFIEQAGFTGPVVDYRALLGEHGSVSAVAAVMAYSCVQDGALKGVVEKEQSLNGKGILLLNLGRFISAVEIIRA